MTSKIEGSSRDPYPYPLFENDNTLQGGVFERKQAYGMGEHLIGQKDPWVRLHKTPTLSSARHEVFHHDPQAPRNDLDFVIKSTYNQHDDLFRSSAEIYIQKETQGNPDGRVLRNKVVEVIVPPPELGHPLKKCEQKEKKSLNQAKGAIPGHHAETTNRGYSRKIDGGYFN